MKKRAQGGLSINVIIVAAIALIVLVVLIAIFTGKMGDFVSRFTKAGDSALPCSEQEGSTTLRDTCDEDTEEEILSSDATAQGMKCCKVKTE